MVVSLTGYANVLNADNPVATGLHSESEPEAESSSPATSVNPAMMYALLALIGCIVNFSLLIGVGVLCLRNRRQSHLTDARNSYYDNDADDVTRISTTVEDLRTR